MKKLYGVTFGLEVGIACGPSGLVVIDLDAPRQIGQHHGRDVLWDLMQRDRVAWTQTYTVMTPGDGVHLYYRAPADLPIGNSASQVGQNIDIRATGGRGGRNVLWRPAVALGA